MAVLLSIATVCFNPAVVQAALVETDILAEDVSMEDAVLEVSNNEIEDVEIEDIGDTEDVGGLEDLEDIGDIEDTEIEDIGEIDAVSGNTVDEPILDAETEVEAEAEEGECTVEVTGNAASTIAQSTIDDIFWILCYGVDYGESLAVKIDVNEVSADVYDGTPIKEDLTKAFAGATVPVTERYLTIEISMTITDLEGVTKEGTVTDLGQPIDVIYTPTNGVANLRTIICEDPTAAKRSQLLEEDPDLFDLTDKDFFVSNGDIHIAAQSFATFAFGYAEDVYGVWFNGNGSNESFDPVYTNKLGELPTPTNPEGWDFMGWVYQDGTKASPGDSIAKDTVLVATWKAELSLVSTKDGDFWVTPNEDGANTVTIVEAQCKNKKININTLKALKVTRIYMCAFAGDEKLTDLTIGPNVRLVGEEAFNNCERLKVVRIGNSVESISGWSFAFCPSLKSVKIGNGVKTVGEAAFYGCGQLKKLTIGSGVESIGKEALAWCPNITNVNINMATIPTMMFAGYDLTKLAIGPNVKSIGYGAFSNCEKLESVDLSNVRDIGDDAFAGCTKLKTVKFGKSLQTVGEEAFYYSGISGKVNLNASVIGNGAFNDCYRITAVKLGNNVKIIGDEAFNDCKKLKSLVIGSGVESIGDDAFGCCYQIKTLKINAANIPARLFEYCDNITKLTFGPNVQSIGEAAFLYCYKLKIASLNNVTTVGKYAFSNTGITELTIPAVITVDAFAFEECPKLKTVKIGNGVKTIEAFAFSDCEGLNTVVISGSVEEINPEAFAGCFRLKTVKLHMAEIPDTFRRNASIKKVVLGSNVKKISDYAFEGCSKLKKVEFSKNLESIGDMAFANSGITSVNVSCDLGNGAFYDCPRLKTVVLGKKAHMISDEAFYNCEKLKTVKMAAPETIGDSAFYGCDSLEKIDIANSAKSIGDYAFAHCYALKSATIGTSVEHIGECAYVADCRLKTIAVKSQHLTELDSVGADFLSGIKTKAVIKLPPAVFEQTKTVFVTKSGAGDQIKYCLYAKKHKK